MSTASASIWRVRSGAIGTMFDHNAVFFDAVRQDPVLSMVKLIAEPWDTGPDGYQLGNFPPGWAEWNDKYRDTVRSFWKGDEGVASELAGNLLGSAAQFERRGRRPWASVNFVTAHDGFTLADVVSFNDKHNGANGEDNNDGHSHNLSWNCGAEGSTEDGAILDLRDRMRRNLVATVLLSQGTPMLLMGDELGRSQGGNNNAYCQDNAMNWLAWENHGERDEAFFEFIRSVTKIRADHSLLRQWKFLHGNPHENGEADIRWLRPDGEAMEQSDWEQPHTRSMAVLLSGPDSHLLMLLNAHFEDVEFKLPRSEKDVWRMLIDTAKGFAESKGKDIDDQARIPLPGRALYLLAK